MDGELVFEPGHLAFGELAGAEFYEGDGFGEGELVVEVVDDLFVAECLGGGSIFAEAVLEQELSFGDQAGREHGIDALVDAVVEVGAIGFEADEREVGGRRPFGALVGVGFVGEANDFEGADDAAGVLAVDFLKGGGVGLLKFVQELGEGSGFEFGAEIWIGGRSFAEALEEGVEV